MNDTALKAVSLPSGDEVAAKPMTVGAIRRAIEKSKDGRNKQDDVLLNDLLVMGTIMRPDGTPRFASQDDILELTQPDFQELVKLTMAANGYETDAGEDSAGN